MTVIDRLRNTATLWWTLLTLGLVALLFEFYGHVLMAPDSVLLVGGGDGVKNYFSLIWHAKHDASFLHFTGSGYPYGEQVFFTDGHPLLSWLLQLLPFPAPHSVGILNSLLFLGILVCAWCLYAVLRHLDLPPWAAAIGAFGITVMQPQIFRLGGHLSLAHAWMIPLLMLLLLRTRTSKRWLKWSLISALAILVEFFTHPYVGLMGVLFVLSYYVLSTPFRKRWRERRSYLEPVVMAVMPMVIFLLLLGWGDPTTDRPASPQGAEKFSTTFMSLIVPMHDPFVTPLRDFIKYDAIDWETWCYLGLSSLLVLVVAAGVQVKRWAARAERIPLDPVGTLLGASFLVLLFAMGTWQDWFGDLLPMLAQFRGAGRFAWVFYYACTIFCTVRLYHWLFSGESVRRWTAVVAYVVVVGFYAVEGWAYHVEVGRSLGLTPNLFRSEELSGDLLALTEEARNSGALAIVPLPFLHEGSELYQKDAPKSAMAAFLPIAYHSSIPVMAGITSRTSLQHTRDLLALRAPSYYTKHLSAELPTEGYILLYNSGDPMDPDEQALWDRAAATKDGAPGRLRRITVAELLADDGAERREEYAHVKDSLSRTGEWQAAAMGLGLIRHKGSGEEPITGTVRDYTDLFFAEPGLLDSSLTYEFSCEFHAVDQAALNISLILEHVRSDGSDMHWEPPRNVRSMPIHSSDDRTIATLTFTPRDRHRSYKFLLKGPDDMGQRFSVSHVLLRPVQVDAWRQGTWEGRQALFLNNVPLAPLSGAKAP